MMAIRSSQFGGKSSARTRRCKSDCTALICIRCFAMLLLGSMTKKNLVLLIRKLMCVAFIVFLPSFLLLICVFVSGALCCFVGSCCGSVMGRSAASWADRRPSVQEGHARRARHGRCRGGGEAPASARSSANDRKGVSRSCADG